MTKSVINQIQADTISIVFLCNMSKTNIYIVFMNKGPAVKTKVIDCIVPFNSVNIDKYTADKNIGHGWLYLHSGINALQRKLLTQERDTNQSMSQTIHHNQISQIWKLCAFLNNIQKPLYFSHHFDINICSVIMVTDK